MENNECLDIKGSSEYSDNPYLNSFKSFGRFINSFIFEYISDNLVFDIFSFSEREFLSIENSIK